MTTDYETEFSPVEPNAVDEETVVDWLFDGQQRPPAIASDEHLSDETPKTKACPYCAEIIQSAASKCRFCGEFLTQNAARTHAARHFSSQPRQKIKDPGLAAVLSFVIPGLGQVYNGQIGVGIIAGILCLLLYLTIIFGLLMHIFLIYDAYSRATRINNGEA